MLNMLQKLFKHQETSALARIEMEVNIQRAQANGRVTVEMETELKELRKMEAHWEAELQRDKARYELDFQKQKDTQDLEMQKEDAKMDRAMAMFEQVQAKKADRDPIKCTITNQTGWTKQNDLQRK